MNSLLNDINDLDEIIRQMQKMESKMRSGQFIDAWRDCNRIISSLMRNRQDIIKNRAGDK